MMNDPLEERFGMLLAGLESANGLERKRARETLALVGQPAIPRLRELLSSPRRLVRWEAAKALVAMVDPDSVDDFVRVLSDTHSDVRWLAASGLIGLGPRSVVPVLRSLVGPPPARGHMEMSSRVLRELSVENDVLATVVEPLLEVLRGSDHTPVAPRAARALFEIERLAGTI